MELWAEMLAGAKIGAMVALAFGFVFALFSLARLGLERLREHLAWRRSLGRGRGCLGRTARTAENFKAQSIAGSQPER